MIRWTGLAPWEFEFPFPGSLTSTFLCLQDYPIEFVRIKSLISAIMLEDAKHSEFAENGIVCQYRGNRKMLLEAYEGLAP